MFPILLAIPVWQLIAGTAVAAGATAYATKNAAYAGATEAHEENDRKKEREEEKKVKELEVKYTVLKAFTAVGIAVAYSDGEIVKEELNIIENNEDLTNLNENQKKELVDLLKNKPSIIQAFKLAKEVHNEYDIEYTLFRDMIVQIINADGVEHEKELEFKKMWDELVDLEN